MKLSERLCARMNLADRLEKFIEEEGEAIDILNGLLQDENREYDEEIFGDTGESIRIHKYAIELANDMLSQLYG